MSQHNNAAPKSPYVKAPFVIGVAGGTASGKSSVCRSIVERLRLNGNGKRVALFSQDSFYKDLTSPEDNAKASRGDYNFDHPDALDTQELFRVINDLKQGLAIEIPIYDFRTNSRVPGKGQRIEPPDVILIEGILIFYDPNIREQFDLKLFVDADPDIRLARRVERDMKERGRPLKYILHQYLSFVKPAFEEFCLPTKKFSDVIIPRGAENEVAIDLIVQHIQELLRTIPYNPNSNDDDAEDIENDDKDGINNPVIVSSTSGEKGGDIDEDGTEQNQQPLLAIGDKQQQQLTGNKRKVVKRPH